MTNLSTTASMPFRSLADFGADWLVTPGDTIADILEDRGWTQAEFARRVGFTEKHVTQLLKGQGSITQETALRLEKVLGSTARFWLGLEAQYGEQLARRTESAALAGDVDWLKEIPLSHMLKYGWVSRCADRAAQVAECLKFFAVSSVDTWRATCQQPVAAYRAAAKLTRTPAIVATWLRRAESEAQKIPLASFDRAKFQDALQGIRTLTRERDPRIFVPLLKSRCADAGVAVVLVPAPAGCPVSGAAKWIGSQRGLIVLSLRGKSDDKLWFSFFHEAAHLLKHGKSLTFLDILGDDGLDPEAEAEADAFARETLVSAASYHAFVAAMRTPSAAAVTRFAAQQGVSPGIVVGRLQFDRVIPFSYLNHLKVSYAWTERVE